ncbi:MAG: 1,6-anhydro-N-acetylmuramyl-L-alanine amidase AmpD [Burkholderiaceae bacterium]|nr:1,6-anhydro-N-acetylmuramyl-L-alanine amidase AmpD [Burkholderiaceae bacterium]MEB2350875.1 1,6-anhydro-N-acetylmuramyl-L-alanine amidase AmpD [Burkholderiaceae bacterium]
MSGAPGWIAGARRVPSPNCDARPGGVVIDLVVLHYISLPPGRFSGDAIERLFTNRLDADADPSFGPLRGLRVSAHLLVRRRGELIQFVATGERAWHAGASRFLGRERCNDFSIGVELEGDGGHRFTEPQYRRLATLLALLRARHPLRWIAGHSDIAPGRKHDPGPQFDWERVLAWPEASGLVRPYRSRTTVTGSPGGL